MTHFYRHTCGDFDVEATETSLEVTNVVTGMRSRIEFTGDDWPMFVKVHTDGRVLYKRHSDGGAMLFADGQVSTLHLFVTEGNWPCAWGPDGSIHLRLRNPDKLPLGEYHVLDAAGDRVVSHPRVEEAATGFHHIAADGSPVVLHDPALHRKADEQLEMWYIDHASDGTIVALGNGGGPAGCVVKVDSNGTRSMWVPPTDLPHPPFIANGRVAISGWNTPEPRGVPWVPFFNPNVPGPTAPATPEPAGPTPGPEPPSNPQSPATPVTPVTTSEKAAKQTPTQIAKALLKENGKAKARKIMEQLAKLLAKQD